MASVSIMANQNARSEGGEVDNHQRQNAEVENLASHSSRTLIGQFNWQVT